MITPYYRGDYDGEFIVSEARWSDGQKHIQREWIPNPIENKHISGRACILCSADKIDSFDPTKLSGHRGGLLGSKKLQVYAIENVVKHMIADFAVVRDQELLKEISDTDLTKKTTMYTVTSSVIKHPGNFYPIPHGVVSTTIGTALYLACFDEHKEIFILNFGENYDKPKVVNSIVNIAKSYDNVQVYIVDTANRMPEVWKNTLNIKYMPFREWISYCDISV